MPFVLTNARSMFQRIMDRISGPFKNKIALSYIDILIPSETIEEGMKDLERILKISRATNLTLKLKINASDSKKILIIQVFI